MSLRDARSSERFAAERDRELARGAGQSRWIMKKLLREEPSLQAVAAERVAAAGREQRFSGQAGAFSQPCAQCRNSGGGQRRDPLLAALAEAGDVRASAQVHIAYAQMEQFAGTESGLAGQHEQGVVAASGP